MDLGGDGIRLARALGCYHFINTPKQQYNTVKINKIHIKYTKYKLKYTSKRSHYTVNSWLYSLDKVFPYTSSYIAYKRQLHPALSPSVFELRPFWPHN